MKHLRWHIRQARTLAIAALAAFACLDVRSQSIVATIPTTSGPYALAVNPVTNKIYVVSNTQNLVTVIDGSTNATSTVAVGNGPTAIDVDTGSNKIFVANTADSTVTIIDGATNAASTVALNGQPISVAVNSLTHRAYLATQTYHTSYTFGAVEVYDEASASVTDVDRGIEATAGIAINTVADIIYVGNLVNVNNAESPALTIINGADNSYVNDGPFSRVVCIAVDPGANVVLFASINDDTGSFVYTPADGVFYLVYGSTSHQIAVDDATHTSYFSSGLVVDDLTRATSEITGGAGSLPTGVVFDNAGKKVYYSDFGNPGGITVYDPATMTSSSVSFGTGAVALVENPSTEMLYVLNVDGTVTAIDISGRVVAPSVLYGPQAQTVAAGSPVVMNAVPLNTSGVTYQWYFNGSALTDGAGISGSATGTLYISRGVVASDAGTYTCTLANSAGSSTTTPAALSVSTTASPGRLVNLSSRALVTYPNSSVQANIEPVIAGFGISGTGKKSLVLRGIGPGLIPLGVETSAITPSLTLLDTSASPNVITSDTGWQSAPSAPTGPWAGVVAPVDATAGDFQAVGAFALAAGSADDAVKIALPAGTYTEEVVNPIAQNTGYPLSVLAEIYDADPAGSGSSLTNISTQAYAGPSFYSMTAGFVIAGSTSQTILIRISGPALAQFGTPYLNVAPILNLYDSRQNLIGSNSAWGGTAPIVAAAAQVGAFPWTDLSSKDDAILITLPPGAYTAAYSGEGFGDILIEVYAVSATP